MRGDPATPRRRPCKCCKMCGDPSARTLQMCKMDFDPSAETLQVLQNGDPSAETLQVLQNVRRPLGADFADVQNGF